MATRSPYRCARSMSSIIRSAFGCSGAGTRRLEACRGAQTAIAILEYSSNENVPLLVVVGNQGFDRRRHQRRPIAQFR